MGAGVGLRRFAFSIVKRAVHFPTVFSANAIAPAPEIKTVGLIGQVAQSGGYAAILDFKEPLLIVILDLVMFVKKIENRQKPI